MPESKPPPGECWFLDVGQGLSNIVLLDDGRAIVIDAGPTAGTIPLQLLKRYVHTVELLVLSHNDQDHDGGAARIVEAYPRAINRVLFLVDRPAKELTRTLKVLLAERAAGNLFREPERLEVSGSNSGKPRLLYKDDASGIRLFLLYPTFMENLGAESGSSKRANATSAILTLVCGGRRIVFSGDANIEAWEALASRIGSKAPLTCEILTVPHHGGAIASGNTNNKSALDRLYSSIVKPKYAVVSVGTTNTYGHPLPQTLGALNRFGVRVLCTQMTPQCSSDLEKIRPGVLFPLAPSQSSALAKRTGSGRSKDVACAGSLVAEVRSDAIVLTRVDEHATSLTESAASGRCQPLCM